MKLETEAKPAVPLDQLAKALAPLVGQFYDSLKYGKSQAVELANVLASLKRQIVTLKEERAKVEAEVKNRVGSVEDELQRMRGIVIDERNKVAAMKEKARMLLADASKDRATAQLILEEATGLRKSAVQYKEIKARMPEKKDPPKKKGK